MADISISITGDAMAYFARAPQALDRALVAAITDGATMFLALMTRYPPPPQNSTYRRTRTLGRSWSMRPATKTSDGWRIVTGSNGAISPYNRYVQDRERQAAIHRGRWLTAQSAAEQQAATVQRFADARIRAALGGL